MIENQKITKYPSANKKTETYQDGDTFVTKHFYDEKDAYAKEIITLKDGVEEIKHFTQQGILSKVDHFKDAKRDGLETKYIVSKADKSIKSTKIYADGKLHGQSLTYSQTGQIIKHEVFALGKLVLKYLREGEENSHITSVKIIDQQSVDKLEKEEFERLQTFI